MPITRNASGTTYTGRAVDAYRFHMIIQGLKLHMRNPGMKLTRGPSTMSVAKRTTGLRTNNPQAHIDWLNAAITEALEAEGGGAEATTTENI